MLCLLTSHSSFVLSISSPLSSTFFFFNATATTAIYTLSLHDALPIFPRRATGGGTAPRPGGAGTFPPGASTGRSEEHTSELQSLRHLVCRLLLEKKKKTTKHKRDGR